LVALFNERVVQFFSGYCISSVVSGWTVIWISWKRLLWWYCSL